MQQAGAVGHSQAAQVSWPTTGGSAGVMKQRGDKVRPRSAAARALHKSRLSLCVRPHLEESQANVRGVLQVVSVARDCAERMCGAARSLRGRKAEQ